jgi:hypothetical protein
MTKQTEDKIAELERQMAEQKRELDALKAAQAPPTPFTPEPYQRWDPTAGMSMPRSTMQEMTAVNYDPRQDAGAHRHVHSHAGVIPEDQMPRCRGVVSAGDGTGWRDATPLGPQPSINYVDRVAADFERQDRIELIERTARERAIEQVLKAPVNK